MGLLQLRTHTTSNDIKLGRDNIHTKNSEIELFVN